MADSEITLAIKYIFSKNILIDANAEGQRHNLEVKEQNDNINKTMTTFTEKTGNDIYKPYFANISKYENEVKIDREILFAETALNVLRDMRKIKCDETKKFLNDTKKCVDILNEIIHPLSLAE